MEKCQRCGEVGEDRRTLRMECFYNMAELPIPFTIQNAKLLDTKQEIAGFGDMFGSKLNLYTLRVCKDCRSDWMQAIRGWFTIVQKPQSTGSGIFVRNLGKNEEI